MYSAGSFVCGLISTGAVLWFHFGPGRAGEDPVGFLLPLVAAGVALIVFGGAGSVLGAAGLYLGERRRWAAAGLALSLWPWALLVLGLLANALT